MLYMYIWVREKCFTHNKSKESFHLLAVFFTPQVHKVHNSSVNWERTNEQNWCTHIYKCMQACMSLKLWCWFHWLCHGRTFIFVHTYRISSVAVKMSRSARITFCLGIFTNYAMDAMAKNEKSICISCVRQMLVRLVFVS